MSTDDILRDKVAALKYAAQVDAERSNQLEAINHALMAEVERLRKEYAILEAQYQRVSAQADEFLAYIGRTAKPLGE